MTLLIASVFVESPGQAAQAAQRAFREGADAVELRIDAYDGDPSALAAYLQANRHRRWIVTCRSATEGGLFRGDTRERVSRLIAVARSSGAYVDFELADWKRSSNIRQKVLLAASSDAGGPRLILSSHDVHGCPHDLDGRVASMLGEPPVSAGKVAYQGRSVLDSFAALDLLNARGKSLVAICTGEEGLWTRVLARKLGAFATFCSLTGETETAPGQVTLEQMRRLYRWDAIDRGTRVYGVIGDPVGHSRGPLLFNHWFAQSGVNAVYVPLRVAGAQDLGAFLDACRTRPWLDVGGFSVTLPHKAAALKWVGEGADRFAGWVGAVNTLVFEGLSVRGYNTDSYAAIASLTTALGCSRADLVGMNVDLLGAGGSARAILEALGELGCAATVYVRSVESAKDLAERPNVRVAEWNERLHRSGQIVIHCTPLGMWPATDESAMPAEALGGCRLVFDLVYNPLDTKLLKHARAAGCVTLNGLDMFVRQAATQFRLWTGREPDARSAMELLTASFEAPPASGVATVDSGRPTARSAGRPRPCIALIGMRGSGKTTVGRALAALLGGDHIDLDDRVVQRAACSIAELFAREGEAGFRRRESAALRDVLEHPPRVLSVGGGAILDSGNVQLLRDSATIVWLTAPAEVLWRRIRDDPRTAHDRPSLTELRGQEEVVHVLDQRREAHERAADLVVDTSQRDALQVADDIARHVRLPIGFPSVP